jgi:NAD-dependent deacetylase
MDEHQGIAPCIPRWKRGVYLSTLMLEEIDVGGRQSWLLISPVEVQNQRVTIPAELLQRLAAAKSVIVLTGAGVSAESGVPTFRDAQTGLWAKYRPEELATPRAFRRNPRLVWEWYEWRRKLVADANPNPAHLALAEMERRFPQFQLITQNVDGLHHRAGSRNVIELHGNITRTKCFDEGTLVSNWKDTGDVPPKCPACGGLLRPDVVWFEEPMPEVEMELATMACATCDVFFSIGTSAVVYPAAGLPTEALHRGATLVEINPQPTPFTMRAHFALTGAAGVVLPELMKALNASRRS